MNDDQRRIALDNMATLQRAEAFEQLIATPGWKILYAVHEEWAERYALAARKVATNEPDKALDALRQWQLADEFIRIEADLINQTMERAHEIRGTVNLDEALLMEQLKHEHQSTEPGTTDPAGY